MSRPPLQWSAADAQGLCSAAVDPGPGFPLGRKRWLRAAECRHDTIAILPTPQRELLRQWLADAKDRRTWDSLQKIATAQRLQLARDTCDALLSGGWIERGERKDRLGAPWRWTTVLWRERAALHAMLGLPPPDLRVQVQAQIAGADFVHADLAAARDALRRQPSAIAQRRLALLRALEHWMLAGRDGTRREFAQFAAEHTKAIADSDWRWLADVLDLETAGVHRHSPALWLRAPLRLQLRGGDLDLRGVPDLIGLSPATIEAMSAIEGRIGCWRVVENRTSFEHAARGLGGRDGVIWLPGHAPAWWLQAVDRLLRYCPAPARIACDPDPAGVEIALNAARCWESRGLDWSAWHMDEVALLALPKRLRLTAYDRATIARLAYGTLPDGLRRLLAAMRALDDDGKPAKGEQEGLDLLSRD